MKILVYGSKEFAMVVREVVLDCGHQFVGFVDDLNPAEGDVVGAWDLAEKKYSRDHAVVIAVGYKNLAARWAVYSRVTTSGFSVATLIHPNAYVARTATVKDGAIIMAGANVDSNALVNEVSVLWPTSVLSHDSVIGPNTFLSPGAIICGSTRVGRDCFIGAGATVVDHCVVPDGAFVKAGSLYKGRSFDARTASEAHGASDAFELGPGAY